MPALRAVVFDLDDTLYPERSYVLSGFRAVAAWAEVHLGIPQLAGAAALQRLFEEGIRGNTFNLWLESRGLTAEKWVPHLVQIYRDHLPQITPYPEIVELLPRLRSRYRLGLVTDGYLQVQRQKFSALGLDHYFDSVIFSDELGSDAWKPSPRAFMDVLERLDVAGEEAVYVADNPKKDFLGARRAGMRTVRIRRSDGLYCALEPSSDEHKPTVEIKELICLETTLLSITE
jgi:putative hydrolase of the HAD superfamily